MLFYSLLIVIPSCYCRIYEQKFKFMRVGSDLGCHASLTGYSNTTAMKTATGIPVFAHPPHVPIERDCVLTWVYCVSNGMILHFHGDDMIMWPLASSFYMITVQEHE